MNQSLFQKLTGTALKALLSLCLVLGASFPDIAVAQLFDVGAAVQGGNSGDVRSVGQNLTGGTLAMLASGGGHTLAIKADGSLWAWGRNDKGQLGDGTTINKNAPVRIGDERWAAVATGYNFSFAIKRDGTLWAWGYNSAGQLGTGNTSDSPVPVQVGTDSDWFAISAGHAHSIGVRRFLGLYTFYTWGSNEFGQLGDVTENGIDLLLTSNGNPVSSRAVPTRVRSSQGRFWVAVAAGGFHSLLLDSDNLVWAFGANDRGQLGDGTTVSQSTIFPVRDGASQIEAVAVAAGDRHSLVIGRGDGSIFGSIFACGANESGQLGDGTNIDRVSAVRSNFPGPVSAIAAGKSHSLAISESELFVWGQGSSGQLFIQGGRNSLVSPSLVEFGTGAVLVSGGDQASSVLYSDERGGYILSSGRNVDGQLGSGVVQIFAAPVPKVSEPWREVSVGLTHTLAIKADGTLWAWGDNASGQLGTGGIDPSSVPVLINGDPSWTKVVAGPTHSAALKGTSLYVWGNNFCGQVGNNSTATALSPVLIPGLWQDVAVGLNHTLGVKSNGNLFSWGANGSGQLGRTKSSTNQLTPLLVGSSTAWTKVAAGDQHSLGLQGTNLYVWGQNAYGQLGTGNNTESAAPVKIATGGWAQIAASGANSAGILTGGSLYVWGNNQNGQLGNGGNQPSSKPVLVRGGSPFSAVSLSSTSAAGISGGSLYVWGSNESSRLGDGTATKRSIPVRVGSASWTRVAIGGASGLGISGGSLLGWGSNAYGQLGESIEDTRVALAIQGGAPDATVTAQGDLSGSSQANSFDFADADRIVFTANTSGTGPFTYQWRKGGEDIFGATGPTYEIPAARSSDAGAYTVFVSNSYGDPKESLALAASYWISPSITQDLSSSLSFVSGTTQSLSVSASPAGVSYAWTKDGAPFLGNSGSINIAANGTYRVTVSNSRNGLPISVLSTASVVSFYQGVTLADSSGNRVGSTSELTFTPAVGGTVALSVSAANATTYQWRKDFQNITSGGTSPTYTITIDANAGGTYDVIASNPASSVTSKPALVRVLTAPTFIRQPASQLVADGKTATLSVLAAGYPTPTIQWYGPLGLIAGATSNTLNITGFSSLKAGQYYAIASNGAGVAQSTSASLSLPTGVSGAPSVSNPVSQTVVAGGSASFSVVAQNATQYQWRKNGVNIPGKNEAFLSFVNVQAVDAASYSVVVSNSVSSVVSSAAILSLKVDTTADDRKNLFNALYGGNAGLFASRIVANGTLGGGPGSLEGYVRLNVSRAGTVSGVYTAGMSVYRFSGRFALVNGVQTTETALTGSDKLRLSVSSDLANPKLTAQVVRTAGSSVVGPVVTLSPIGTRDKSLATVYTGAFKLNTTGALLSYLSTQVNLSTGNVTVSGALPTGERFSASSQMYADARGIITSPLSDFVIPVGSTKRLFATWELAATTHAGDAVVVTAGTPETSKFDLVGAKYSKAAVGELIAPFVSTRDQAVVLFEGTEVASFLPSGNRFLPGASTLAALGGRFSLSFNSNTGLLSGVVSTGNSSAVVNKQFNGVLLQGDFRPTGGLLGVGVTTDGKAIRFEPAN